MERWLAAWQSLLWEDGLATAWGLGAIALFTVAEAFLPAETGHGWRGRGRNLVFLLQYKVLGLGATALWLTQGPIPPRWELGTASIAPALLVLVNLLLVDFLFYWYHRAQHRFRPLWAIHELHHSDAELNATTSYRSFWLEILAQTVIVSTPTFVFFGHLGGSHAIAVLSISVFVLIFTHANLRLALGPFSPVVCGPQVHRIHHSRLPQHRDRNFAQVFPVLDQLFGTYHAPTRDEFPPTGAEDLPSDVSLMHALRQPFHIWGETFGRTRSELGRKQRGSDRQPGPRAPAGRQRRKPGKKARPRQT